MQKSSSKLINSLSLASAALTTGLVVLALGAGPLPAQTITDDFNNGADSISPTNWAHYALPAYGAPTYSFPTDGSGGYAYRIQAPPAGRGPPVAHN